LERQTPRAAQPAHAPDDLDALKKRADAAREANRLEEAAAVYQQAVRLHPRWIEGHWYLGTISHELGKYAVCQSELRQVVRVQSRNGAAWAIKGLCEFQLKSYTAALDDLTRASKLGVGDDPGIVAVVALPPGDPARPRRPVRARIRRGCRLYSRGEQQPRNTGCAGHRDVAPADAAIRGAARQAGDGDPCGPGRKHEHEPNRESGLQLFQQLVSRYPDAPNVHYVYGTALAGDRPDEALEQFKQELSVSPGHALARVQIALELIKRSEYDAAMPYAMQAVRLAPRDFLARKALGQVKLQTGDLAGAIMELEKARALEPSSPSVRYQLSRAYQRAGRDGGRQPRTRGVHETRSDSTEAARRGERGGRQYRPSPRRSGSLATSGCA
jgi:tetratricopeptide (TPR) repeat protein